MRDAPYNASDRDDVRQSSKEARAAAAEDEDVFRQIMATRQGRAWMYRRLGNCCVFQTTFTGDPHQSAFLEGQRNIGLMFLNETTRLCSDLFMLMLREANERAIISDVSRNRRASGADDAADDIDRNSVDYTEQPVGSGTNGTGGQVN